MTLENATARVKALLCTESDGENARIKAFLNMAQCDMALWVPIVKTCTLNISGGRAAAPQDLREAISLTYGRSHQPFYVSDGYVCAQDGEATLEYRAYPPDVENSGDTFAVGDAAASFLPYYAAALCVMHEDGGAYSSLMALYTAGVKSLQGNARIRL